MVEEDFSKLLEAALPQDIAAAVNICEDFEMEVFCSLNFAFLCQQTVMTNAFSTEEWNKSVKCFHFIGCSLWHIYSMICKTSFFSYCFTKMA
jgi:uncharacterized protein with PQ loop repeat